MTLNLKKDGKESFYCHDDGIIYCGHTVDDGHAYHTCGVSGCTQTQAHTHTHASSHHSGHHGGRHH